MQIIQLHCIRASLSRCPIVFSPFVRPSVQNLLSRAYISSFPWLSSFLDNTSPTERVWVKNLQWFWNMFLGLRLLKVRAELHENPCPEHMFSPLDLIWLILYSQNVFCPIVCDIFEWSLQVKVISVHATILSSAHICYPLSSTWVIFYINKSFE